VTARTNGDGATLTEIEWRNSQNNNDDFAFRYVSYFLYDYKSLSKMHGKNPCNVRVKYMPAEIRPYAPILHESHELQWWPAFHP